MSASSFSVVRSHARQADIVMLVFSVILAGLTLYAGQQGHVLAVSAWLVGAASVLAVAGLTLMRQPMWSSVALSAAATVLSCGLIHVTRGRPEACLAMFLLGSLLVHYRNWRLMAGVLATLMLFHAVFRDHFEATRHVGLELAALTLQYAYMGYLAWQQERSEAERFELDFLIRAMGHDGPIRLNLDVLRADSAVGQRLEHVQQRMAETIRQVYASIDGVQSASQVLRQGSEDLSARTHSTASGLRDAAMCLDQINVIVQTSAKASLEARAMAVHATELANDGGEQVRQVVSTMQEISHASSKITDIIAVIDGIAFQTNILALNAAVEAARAGEQGRGFAVVASEVRSLALRSSEAAREIKTLISSSMQTVEAGVRQVNQTGSTMENIVQSVRRVGEVFEQLSADSHEHAGGIDVVTQSVKELDAVTQQNIHVAQDSGRIAAELMAHAGQMTQVLSAFRLGGTASTPAASPAPSQAEARPRQAAGVASRAVPDVPQAMANPPAAASQGVEFF